MSICKSNEKYKDKHPNETIDIAINYLMERGFSTTEEWFETGGCLYSVLVRIEGTRYFSNGKGTSRDYALASAYGELMERVQNLVFFSFNSDIYNFDLNDYKNNTYIFENTLDSFELNMSKWIEKVEINNKKLFNQEWWRGIGNYKFLRYQKFNEVNGNSNFILPKIISDYYYGTNGMAAGNTLDEAIVQGLSEVIERFINKKVIEESYSPPDITNLMKSKSRSVSKYISLIEKSGQYKIEIKDLTYGSIFPAIGLVLYDLKSSNYFVKIGVHPKEEIAIERCFTELLQGKSLVNYSGMSSIVLNNEIIDGSLNLYKIFINGSGLYPDTFFIGTETDEFSFFETSNVESNNDMRKLLIELIYSIGYNVYIFNSTKSQISSVQIIVPGLSEIIPLENYAIIKTKFVHERITNLIESGLVKLTSSEIIEISDYIINHNYNMSENLSKYFKVSRIKSNPVNKIKVNLFVCLLSLKIKNYNRAIIYLESYLETLENHSKEHLYYSCFLMLIKRINKKYTDEDIKNVMRKFFSCDLIEKVIFDFNNDPLVGFSSYSCLFNCNTCSNSSNCWHPVEMLLYQKVSHA